MEFVPYETIKFGKERKLKLSYRVMEKFKKATGSDFNRCLAAGFTAEEMIQLLYASFSEEDPELTLDELKDMFHAGRYAEIVEKIIKLVSTSFPDPSGDEGKNASGPTPEKCG